MERKRKSFCYLTTKIYGGKPNNKTLGIHFGSKDRIKIVQLARAILQAIEYDNGLDITVFIYQPLKDGSTRVTITAPKKREN